MNQQVHVDWRVLAVVGATLVGAYLVHKMDKEAANRVATEIVDAWKGRYLPAKSGR